VDAGPHVRRREVHPRFRLVASVALAAQPRLALAVEPGEDEHADENDQADNRSDVHRRGDADRKRAGLPPSRAGASVFGVVVSKLVGPAASRREEVSGYWFWGLIAAFIAVPELLAAFSKELKADIPWPTISNLVGKDLERHHHWVAALVVGLIAAAITHAFTRPVDQKQVGYAVRRPAKTLDWAWQYAVLTAALTSAAGFTASALGGSKNEIGYAIYGALALLGVVVPSALAYFWRRVLSIPTLFATVALLEHRRRWVAVVAVSLLVVLAFHLALYPWPNVTG
jgi:hypothetical protein